ncbi:putative transporter [Escherichia coli]|uniref:Putative transporter n=1 Tax=Escherichia coli TaxID=562 RepID=A0A485JP29_ECOLX|nr:putative transporter [Escherichia coli]
MLDSRRKIGPKGKFRPFILYASFPVTLLAIANFVGTPFDVTGKTVMATILFMLYGLFFSMMNCSYGAMVPAITKPNERASLAHGVRAALRWACCCARWDSCRL